MKMEVLSVQNQFQGQFGVIGSTKVKDWTSPLTSPLPTHRHHHRNHHHHHQNNRHHHSNTHYSSNNVKVSDISIELPFNEQELNTINNQDSIDVVDGFLPKIVDGQYAPPQQQQQQQQQQKEQQKDEQSSQQSQEQYYHYYHNQISTTMPGALVTTLSSGKINNDDDDVVVDSSKIDYQINELSIRLQCELREAKSRHLACTEVSLPWDLTPRIAAEIIRLSEKEPCGIRGCTIYIEFEDEPSNTRRIASLKIDPNTVSTFELYLTLKHDKSGWTSLLPQFIKNLTRSSSIIISPDFSLTKNKLYHSSSE